jgi:hypothetical protein
MDATSLHSARRQAREDYRPRFVPPVVADPELLGTEYDALWDAVQQVAGDGGSAIEQLMRNRDRGALHPEEGDVDKLGSRI